MKSFMKLASLVTRLATVTAVLLFSQQAMAAGTAAGTIVSNTATVDYSVGAVAQTAITSAAADFTVDNRVDMTLVGAAARTIVTPGQTLNVVAYTLMNTGNETQDYQFAVTALVTPDFQMLVPQVFVETDGNAGYSAADTDLFVGSLAADASIVVYVVANAPAAGIVDGNQSDVELQAITADAGSGGATATVATAGGDNPGVVDVVLAVQGVNGQGDILALGGYVVETILLGVTKSSLLIDDPFNGATNPYAIPGATVRYTIDVANPSATTGATAVQIDDALVEVLITAGATVTLTNGVLGGVAAATCTADVGDADVDGCGVDQAVSPQALEIGNANADFTIAPATTLSIVFDTTIL